MNTAAKRIATPYHRKCYFNVFHFSLMFNHSNGETISMNFFGGKKRYRTIGFVRIPSYVNDLPLEAFAIILLLYSDIKFIRFVESGTTPSKWQQWQHYIAHSETPFPIIIASAAPRILVALLSHPIHPPLRPVCCTRQHNLLNNNSPLLSTIIRRVPRMCVSVYVDVCISCCREIRIHSYQVFINTLLCIVFNRPRLSHA